MIVPRTSQLGMLLQIIVPEPMDYAAVRIMTDCLHEYRWLHQLSFWKAKVGDDGLMVIVCPATQGKGKVGPKGVRVMMRYVLGCFVPIPCYKGVHFGCLQGGSKSPPCLMQGQIQLTT